MFAANKRHSLAPHTSTKEISLRHFVAYHNEKMMGYSCTAIPEPRVQTGNSVEGLEGVTVWLVAGEGKSSKSYFLAAQFVASRCKPNSFPSSRFPHLIAGPGTLFGRRIPIGGTVLFALLQTESANFVRGFYETKNPAVIAGLKLSLTTSGHAIKHSAQPN